MEPYSKSALIGDLAIGVAHEMINPANGIINYAQVLSNGGMKDGRVKEIARRISSESERLAVIAQSLLSLGHPGGNHFKSPVRVETILDRAVALIEPVLRRDGICLRIEAFSDIPPILAVAPEIQQVFINLLTNARDALNEKYAGTCTEKNRIEITARRIFTEKGQSVRISFLDYGTGIPENMRGNIKAPFFTTKAPGRGTGLGLSISSKIVAEHGGRIEVESLQGHYTNMMVELPAASDEEMG